MAMNEGAEPGEEGTLSVVDVASNLQGLDSRVMALVGWETVTGSGCRTLEEDGDPIRTEVSTLYKICIFIIVCNQCQLRATRKNTEASNTTCVTMPCAMLPCMLVSPRFLITIGVIELLGTSNLERHHSAHSEYFQTAVHLHFPLKE